MFCVASRKPFYLALSKRLYVCMFIWGCVFVSFVRGRVCIVCMGCVCIARSYLLCFFRVCSCFLLVFLHLRMQNYYQFAKNVYGSAHN